MPETDRFSSRPYFFSKKEKCKSSVKYTNTNPRFPSYKQIFFTAGDHYDLERYGLIYAREIALSSSSEEGDLTYQHVRNTMKYMFEGFKKGILVVVRKNRLCVFLPFVNHAHTWDDISGFITYDRIGKDVEPDKSRWGINNCIFKERPGFTEGDQSFSELRYLLELLLEKRQIPDVILFFNVRDFPIVRKDFEHPYTSIVPPGYKVKEELHIPLYPVLSFCTHRDHHDIPIPTSEDVRRIRPDVVFPDRCDDTFSRDRIIHEWDKKISKAFFRGSTTGCGVGPDDNMRIKVHLMSQQHPDLLDCAVVTLNNRIRKPSYDSPVKSPRFGDIIGKPGTFADNRTKSGFKYILNLDGHSRAYRLSSELSYSSVLLLQESPYRLWFEDRMEPFVHYVPVASDLSDLIEKVTWCRANDDKCRVIAEKALAFYCAYLTEEKMLDHLQSVVSSIHKRWRSPLLPLPNVSVAVITIYRDDSTHQRKKQRNFFLKRMMNLPVDVYVVEQVDKHPFNIGALKNIGFQNLKKKYQSIVMTDIDLLPDTELLLNQWFSPKEGGIVCMAWRGTRYYSSVNQIFAGGMIGVDPEAFIRANGFPNDYYGWGGEDTALAIRLHFARSTFFIPIKGSVIDNELTTRGVQKSLIVKLNETEKNTRVWEYIAQEHQTYHTSGLRNLEYKLVKSKTTHERIHVLKVSLPPPHPRPIPNRTHTPEQIKKEMQHAKWTYTSFSNNTVRWV